MADFVKIAGEIDTHVRIQHGPNCKIVSPPLPPVAPKEKPAS